MATSKDYKNFILEKLSKLNPCYKSMMGEFLLYVNGVYFGGIFDDRLLIKKTHSNSKYNLVSAKPYENAKPMGLVENVDDEEYLEELVLDTIKGLKNE